MKKYLSLSLLCMMLAVTVLAGCTYQVNMGGSDLTNSTKVNKITFVEEYKENYADETEVSSLSNTTRFNARVYLTGIPGDTDVLLTWKTSDGQTIDEITLKVTPENAKVPAQAYLTASSAAFPAGEYTLEVSVAGKVIGTGVITVTE